MGKESSTLDLSAIESVLVTATAKARKSCEEFRDRARKNALPGAKPSKLTRALVSKAVAQALEPHKETIFAAAVEQVGATIAADPD